MDIFNNTHNIEEMHLDPRRQIPDSSIEGIPIAIINTIIFVLGSTGNVWICFSKPLCPGNHHLYVKHLAFTNIITILLMPFYIANQFLYSWPFGRILCTFGEVTRAMAFAATPYFIIILNIDFMTKLKDIQEYIKKVGKSTENLVNEATPGNTQVVDSQIIVDIPNHNIPTRKTWIVCSIIYVISLCPCSIGPMLYSSPSREPDVFHCWIKYDWHTMKGAIYILAFVSLYLIPLFITGPLFLAGRFKLTKICSEAETDSNTPRKYKFNLINNIGYFVILGTYWIVALTFEVFVRELPPPYTSYRNETITRLYTVFLPIVYFYLLKMRRGSSEINDEINSPINLEE